MLHGGGYDCFQLNDEKIKFCAIIFIWQERDIENNGEFGGWRKNEKFFLRVMAYGDAYRILCKIKWPIAIKNPNEN